jgi:hypothetical protein
VGNIRTLASYQEGYGPSGEAEASSLNKKLFYFKGTISRCNINNIHMLIFMSCIKIMSNAFRSFVTKVNESLLKEETIVTNKVES